MEIHISSLGKLIPRFLVSDSSVLQEFKKSSAAGLFALLQNEDIAISEKSYSYRYFREFAAHGLRHFCFASGADLYLEKPNDDLIATFCANIPEFPGSEHLDAKFLATLWESFMLYLKEQTQRYSEDRAIFLREELPSWYGVGQLHLHLAENPTSLNSFLFLATVLTKNAEQLRLAHLPLQKFVQLYEAEQSKICGVLRILHKLGEKSPFLQELIASKRIFTTAILSSKEAYFLLDEAKIYHECGVLLRLPKTWQESNKLKVQVKVEDASKSKLGFGSLFSFKVEVTQGDKILSQQELSDLLAQGENLVQIEGHWVKLDAAKIKALLGKWRKVESLCAQGIDFSRALRYLRGSPGEECFEDDLLNVEVKSEKFSQVLHRNPSSLDVQSLGEKLKAKLRPYQLEGVSWMRMLSSLSLGGCLADDMGLGKTLQVLTYLLCEQEANPLRCSLLVVPASLLGNWKAEIEKFTPTLRYRIWHPAYPKQECLQGVLDITTYKMLEKVEIIRQQSYHSIIIDEAQAIKNPFSQQTRNIKMLYGQSKFALTGTPIENSIFDLWSIFDFTSPGILGSYKDFSVYWQKDDPKKHEKLRNLLAPFILRRKKTDPNIAPELPAKIEFKTYCSLTPVQFQLYEGCIKKLSVELKEATGLARQSLILGIFTKLKQICNHPSQYLKDNRYDYRDSGKFYRLRHIAEKIAAKGERMLIFTQYREITDILAAYLREIFGRPGFILHGNIAVKERQKMVEAFQNEELQVPFFVLTSKAGGSGLNLTGACHVLHFDRWWNPAVENQASDRAYRIGQKNKVLVHKFICTGTIEEKIDQLLEGKIKLVESTLGGSILQMSNEEILQLVELQDSAFSLKL